MENYTAIKNEVSNRLLFKMSQIGYALNCDVLFTNRVPEIIQDVNLVNNLKDGAKIFISVLKDELTINLVDLVAILQKQNIRVYFYLMYEPILPEEVINLLMPVAHGFYINNNVYNHDLIHCMPIGIRDCGKVFPGHAGFSHDYLYNEGIKSAVKEHLAVLCFSYTHHERHDCYDKLHNLPFIKNLNDETYDKQPSIHCGKVPVWINYEYTHRSYYTLSPRGGGEDCHRFYEAIYLDSIPIVKRTNTPFDKMYNIFPCLIVNDWSDVTEELLLENIDICMEKLRTFKTKYPNAFTDLDSIQELLMLT